MLAQAQAIAPELVRLRRDIHQHPELSFQEVRTAALVAETLQELGIEVQTGIGRTGVVGRLGNGVGPTLAIRADMDALPIQEANDVPYRSQNPGVMHACGHDAHTAILLGVALLLKQSLAEEEWRGNVRLLFQPSEEASDADGISGAPAMMADGALDGVDAAISLHVLSTHPSSVCFFQDGYSHAAVDSFQAWIRARGGHGAYPQHTNDPLFILAPVLTALYAIPSRRIDPLRPCVVSLGEIRAGTASNIIPGEVYLSGTLRSYDPGVREQLRREVESAFKISEAMGGRYELKLNLGYPAMNNDRGVNDWMRAVAADLLGAEAVREDQFGMGAEDFAYVTQTVPGAMFMLGAAIPDGRRRNHHTAGFDIDESVLPLGAAVLAETARRYVTGELRL
ncbi:MAG: M20 metallopeptidase family protein [Candidatus Promineifilaceae bacterium]